MSVIKVLYIDDNRQACLLTKIYLERTDFEVHVCYDTRKARTILDKQAVDCIITDIGLPGENGIAFYEWLQQQPRLKDIPVLFVSAHAVGFDHVLREHRDSFISKPIFFPDLIKRLRKLAANRQAGAGKE